MAALTQAELKAMIKDIIGAEFADKWEEHAAKAREANAREMSAYGRIIGDGAPKAQEPEKGIHFARFVRALAATNNDRKAAAEFARSKWNDLKVSAALQESTLEDGGALVYPEFASEYIELLRARTVVRSLGARTVPMNSGTFTIPFQSAASTAAYVGESKNINPSSPKTNMLTLTARKLAGLVPVSNDLVRDASFSADAFVRDDMLQVMSLREDLAFLRGDGNEDTPKGLLNWAVSGNKFNANATINAQNVFADLTKAIRLVDEGNVPLIKCGWAMAPRTKWYLMSLLNTQAIPIFRDEMMRGTLLTYPFRTTTQIPTNLGAGTDESEIYFADFNSVLIGENTNIEVKAFEGGAYYDGSSVVSGISTDQNVIRAIARHDLGCRFRGQEVSILQAVKWI